MGFTFDAALEIRRDCPGALIDPDIYGHFSEHLGRCIDEGLWVGEDSNIANVRGIRCDVVLALKELGVPVLRWPGGCFADEYHWRDGIGPRDERRSQINSHWGGVVERNHFGTHEFMDLCEQLGAKPYVCGNVGSGSVREMMEWVEYMTSDADSPLANLRRKNGRREPYSLPYFGVGNESWGCGGNMRPEYYADNYRRYATFVKNNSGNRVAKIACGANGADYEWTRVLMQQAATQMSGLSLHFYTLPTGRWSLKGSSTEFAEEEWHSTLLQTLKMSELIARHSQIMDEFDPERRVAMVVDEWGTWYDPLPGTNPGFLEQGNTLRDALVAAINLNVFNEHASRVRMANLAQTVNVLQALIQTDGPRMLRTPTYHAFEMYRVHRGATSLPTVLHAPDYAFGGAALPSLHASASLAPAGTVQLSLVNLDPNREARVRVAGLGGDLGGRLLTAPQMHSQNHFDESEAVCPVAFDGIAERAGSVELYLPAKSLVVVEARPS
jgi:alpha-N-arabinofuranosidase